MILGLIAPTSGSIELFGTKLDGNSWPLIRRVGAIIEEPAFYPYMSGRDNLEALSRSIGGVPIGKIDEVLKRVNLFDRAGDQYGHYSMGMKQRLGIASTLLRDPELIILDEPTSGLDPAGTKEVRDLIPELAHESRAVFLCSHLLHEVEMVCDRVAIIKKGVMLANSTVAELTSQGHQLHIRVANPQAAAAILKTQSWITSVKLILDETQKEYLLVDAPKDSASRINQLLAENKIFASELVNKASSLEDVFLQLTGGNAGD
jgi:ABC-2 type transport system ATP-binding protein